MEHLKPERLGTRFERHSTGQEARPVFERFVRWKAPKLGCRVLKDVPQHTGALEKRSGSGVRLLLESSKTGTGLPSFAEMKRSGAGARFLIRAVRCCNDSKLEPHLPLASGAAAEDQPVLAESDSRPTRRTRRKMVRFFADGRRCMKHEQRTTTLAWLQKCGEVTRFSRKCSEGFDHGGRCSIV